MEGRVPTRHIPLHSKLFLAIPIGLLLIALAYYAFRPLMRSAPESRSPATAGSASGKQRALDASLLIDASGLTAALEKEPDTFLIDVRQSFDFAKLHIPQSINLPLYLLKTKEFLKQKPVVLLNEGYRFRQLEMEALHLRELGFPRVTILDGGLVGWIAAGGEVEGDRFETGRLNKIPADIFFQESLYDHWLLIDVSPAGTAGKVLPPAKHIPYPQSAKKFQAQFEKAIAAHGNSSRALVLLFNQDGSRYEELEPLLATPWPLFFLEGGADAYQAAQERQTHMREPQQLKTRGDACPTCP